MIGIFILPFTYSEFTSHFTYKSSNYLHLSALRQWHFKYSDGVWQSWETDNNKDSFQYSTPFDWAADTNSYLPLWDQRHALYRYHWAGQYTSLPPKGLHLLSEMIFNKVWPQKYRVECSCLDLAYAVKEKKKHFIGIKIQVKITWGNSS